MSINKLRRLLLASPVAGLVGCATNGGFSLGKILGPQLEYGKGKPMTPEEAAQAEQAAAIFAHFFKNKTIPVSAALDVSPTSLRWAVAEWNKSLVATKGKPSLTTTDMAELSMSFVPMLNQLDAAFASLKPGSARTVRPEKGHFGIQRGVLTIPAGGACQFSEKGYCMDPGLPAPSTDERFRFVSINRILPADLHPLYSDLMVASKTDPTVHANMQGLVWLMRSVVTHQQGSTLSDSTKRILNKVRRNGANEFEAARNREALLAPVRDIANLVDSLSSGQGFNPSQLNDVTGSQRAVDDMMRRMSTMKVNTPIPNDNSHMSMPVPGVAVMGIGSGLLKPTVSVINANDTPVKLDLTRFAAVSTRSVQRVSMALPDNLNGGQYPMVMGGVESPFTTDALGAILSAILQDGASLLGDKMTEHAPKIAEKLRPVWALAARSKMVKGAIETVPFVGNLLSAYELVTGTKWAPPHDALSPAERILAGIGIVPAGGALARLAGNSTAPLLKWALSSSGVHLLGEAAEFRELAKDVAGLATGDTAQYFGLDKKSEQAMASFKDAVLTGLASI